MEANAVVLTVPAFQAARLVEGFSPALSGTLKKIPFASTATVSLGFRQEEIPRPMDGYGFIVPRVEGRRILAATWTSTKFPYRAPPGHVLLRCFLGGTLGQEILSLGDQEMIRVVREELRGIMGISAEPVFSKVFRWDNATPQYTVGHQNRLDLIEEALRGFPCLVLTGSSYRGIGIPDCIHQGTLAAERILKDFFRGSTVSPIV
jgi:oxygen-dependent protoporphyrinogen oxidase